MKKIVLPGEEIAKRYLAGESLLALSRSLQKPTVRIVGLVGRFTEIGRELEKWSRKTRTWKDGYLMGVTDRSWYNEPRRNLDPQQESRQWIWIVIVLILIVLLFG